MSGEGMIVVLVHGWSVRNTETYGELPARLRREAKRNPELALDVRNLWLSKYISFHNEVQLEDISRAFEAALRRELGDALGQRPVAIVTHSTGGPVVRDWLQRFYVNRRKRAPISHLVMLAPANFGSPLAQLGRSRLARLKTWFNGVEPGLGVLDWLELGSPESLALNIEWMKTAPRLVKQGIFSFVLTGASIDHSLYDHLNSYTGELDSDGVVRVACANLNFRHVTLRQAAPPARKPKELSLAVANESVLKDVPLAILPGMAHSGDDCGILRSIRNRDDEHPTVMALLDCLHVKTARDYRTLRDVFENTSAVVLARQRVDVRNLPGPFDRKRIKDPCSQVIFRVRDQEGYAVKDFELLLSADGDDPDRLPPGFFVDRQQNRRDPATLTYYLNAARMLGDDPLVHEGEVLRGALPAAEGLGLCIQPYPADGFVHYLAGRLPVSREFLRSLVVPHQTTVVDIELHRVVHEGTYRLTRRHDSEDFTEAKPGKAIS
ncbi:MAG TPA: alpha/beta fold hydrolase [Gammaproteobacteria bacterium]